MRYNVLLFLSLSKIDLKTANEDIIKSILPFIPRVHLPAAGIWERRRLGQYLLLYSSHGPHFLLPRVNAGLREGTEIST